MHQTNQHLNDEHMRLYEWSGIGTVMACNLPTGSKRTHAWHASYGVLAVLTSLLILNGCDSQASAEQAGDLIDRAQRERIDQAQREMNEGGPLYDSASARPAPAEVPDGETPGAAPDS
jgi:hypothetical protein